MVFVTPHVGVWIETESIERRHVLIKVTPHVGVWIETSKYVPDPINTSVTPHVGVWIETFLRTKLRKFSLRHTSCRCVD